MAAEPIAMSGVTDCYQPAERRYRLTRGCLEVASELRQPSQIVTKNALVLRDLDLLREMARANLVHVYLSVTTLDAELARSMEPRTSTPAARLRAVRELARGRSPGWGAGRPGHPRPDRFGDPRDPRPRRRRPGARRRATPC